MDVQLQELIDKIRKDGVASASISAQNIIVEAEKKAAAIISEAEEKADNIIKNAKVETARMEKASEDAITQAGRNSIISFRDSISKEISAIVLAETEDAYNKDLLKKLIPEAVKAWIDKSDDADLTVLLSEKDLKALQSNLKTSLKSQIARGLELKGDNSVLSGFRIGSKNGNAFYDFSAEEVANLFSSYLNPKITKLMKNAAEGIPAEQVSLGAVDEVAEGGEPVTKTIKRRISSAKKAVEKAVEKKVSTTRTKEKK